MRTLVEIDCCECGIVFGVPDGWQRKKRETGATFYCPNGHAQCYRDSDLDKMRRERDRLVQEQERLRQRTTELANQRDAAERRVAAAKGQITKLKKRAAGGACPCCNRTFLNLQRHMATKHQGFVAEPIVLEAAE